MTSENDVEKNKNKIDIHLVCFISNAVKIRLVYEFSTFHGRCLILLLNSAQIFDSRCLFSQLER